MGRFYFEDLGTIDYQMAWEYQKNLFNRLIDAKKSGGKGQNHLLFCEHPHVYTLGKSGNRQNLLITNEQLKQRKATFVAVDRGGDITYHGPGQIVGYPVFDLDTIPISIKDFVFNIEEALILTLRAYNIRATRLEKATGVWLDAHHAIKARKIAAIGMRIHNKVSMHGFALNVNTDLTYFEHIIPCGLRGKGVTSMAKELGSQVEEEAVKKRLLHSLEEVFHLRAANSYFDAITNVETYY